MADVIELQIGNKQTIARPIYHVVENYECSVATGVSRLAQNSLRSLNAWPFKVDDAASPFLSVESCNSNFSD